MSGEVTARGTTIRYWRIDRGKDETVLFLHGLGGDHRGLAELAEAMPSVNVVLPDLPGYGKSGELPDAHSLTNYAHAIDELRIALGLNEFHLLGHSLGASIALVYAALYGDDLASLTLLNPVSTASNVTASLGKLYYRIAAVLPARAARFWLASKPAVYLADAFVINTRDRARRRAILRQDYENYRAASIRGMVESFLSYYDTPFDGHADSVTTRTLLVTGDKDSIAPAASVRGLAERMPNGRFALVPGAGHLMPMELPAEAATLVNAFVSAADARLGAEGE